MNNLGELFRQIRISKNWSIREASKRMGISHSYLSVLEKGIDSRSGKDSNPKPDTLKMISKAYEYPYEELMKAAGYLSEEPITDRKFDLTVFISNINLIMGTMTIEEFSADIYEKTGYNINAKQIRSYLNGDIEPFPGTLNIFSKYARVTPDFWYVFNNQDTLEMENKKFEDNIIKNSADQFNKDYFIFSNIRDDIKNWLIKEESLPYIKVAIDASKKNIHPNSLKLLIDSIISERGK